MVSVGPGTLLGRDAEAGEALQVLTGPNGGCVAVVGAAGIGKSALVREVSAEASASGLAVRTTTGAVSESDLPFLGLHDLVGQDVSTVGLPDTLQEALDVALLRSRRDGAGADPLALNLAILRVIEHVSAERRLVLVLDDLPWVDGASRAALAFVLRRLPADRVSLLVAMRPDADVVVDDLTGSALRTIPLGPLDPATLAAAIELRTGAKLPHRAARHLHELSGGNPLLALELMRTARVDREDLGEPSVPEHYRSILAPRLTALSPDARRALLAASLSSRPTLAELADVVSVDGLLEAEDVDVVRIEDGRILFTHPLFAALCRDTAPSGDRRDMHARLAKTARDELERARHLGSATLLPDEEVAAQVEAAAGWARGRAATAAAAELAERAERLTPSDDLERRAVRGCLAADLFYQTGDIETAEGVVRRLLDDVGPGPLRAQCLATLAMVISDDSEGSVAVLQEALHQPGLDPGFEDELQLKWSVMHLNLGDFLKVRDLTADIEARAEASGRTDLARKARHELAFIEVACGTPPAKSRAWARMVADTPAYGLAYDHPLLLQAWEAMSREDHDRAQQLLSDLMDQARRAGNVGLWAAFALHRNEMELRRGDIAAASEYADQAYRIIADGRHDEAVLSYRALSSAWQGRLEEARPDAEQALAMALRDSNQLYVNEAQHALGFIELSLGRMAEAAEHYAVVADGIMGMGWRHPSLVVWQGSAVEALVGAGRRTEAVAIVEELETMAARFELPTAVAQALRCRAIVLEDEGDLEGAVEALDESVRLSEPLGIPLEHARTLLIRGVVHRRRRQKALSREDLRRARDLFSSCGAVVWADRAERELDRSAAVAAGAELTPSERAVAELAATGSTNREIASSLYLSEKTVEAVLTRVYRKLAVRSRTQLAQHPDLVGAKGHA